MFQQRSLLMILAIFGAIAGIAVLDTVTPIGVIVGMLYICPVYMSNWLPQPWTVLPRHAPMIIVASLCTALTLLSYWLSPAGGDPWIATANSLIATLAIWMTVMLASLHHHMASEIKTLHGLLPLCSYCKKIRDERGDWELLESYIVKHTAADFTHGMCPQCLTRYLDELKTESAVR